jgi:lysyl-tRNA synthetase class 1
METEIDHRPLAAFIYARRIVDEDLAYGKTIEISLDIATSLKKLIHDLDKTSDDATEEQLQSVFYEAGKIKFGDNLRWWFKILYQILLSQDEGPRLGQFTKLMTIHWVIGRVNTIMEDPWGLKTSLTK